MEWVNYKYETLPSNFCYSCGRIGHSSSYCNFKEEYVEGRYGEHSRAGGNSPAAPTPKKPTRIGRAQEDETFTPPRRNQQETSDRDVEGGGGVWENMQGTITRLRGRREGRFNGQGEGRNARGEEFRLFGGGSGDEQMAAQMASQGFPRNLLGEFNSVRAQEGGENPQGAHTNQPLFLYNLSPMSAWNGPRDMSPIQITKKRKKNAGIVIREMHNTTTNMESDRLEGMGDNELNQNYEAVSPYVPMEPMNHTSWFNHYGLEGGQTSRVNYEASNGMVETRKPPEEP
ncbi:hypothetical protein LINPERPRIM_LOCUS5454 [Linum perenne]